MGVNMTDRAGLSIQSCVVGIMMGEKVIGTGFFVCKDGQILTCFHVIGDCATGKLYSSQLKIKFENSEYWAEHVFSSPQPEVLDFAVIQLANKVLPPNASLVSLGQVDEKNFPHEFTTCGYRSENLKENAILASGKIEGVQNYLGTKIIQLNSESPFNTQMRKGMSGSPIFDKHTRSITGMFIEYSKEGTEEIIPIALSLESIASQWTTLWDILDEQDLWRQLSNSGILHFGGKWLTEKAFEDLYSGFPGLIPFQNLGSDPAKELLEQLRMMAKTSEFIAYLKMRLPGIPPDTFPRKKYNVRFLNREDEKKTACESLAPPYIFFEGPMGYGKTRLLAEIRAEHFRRRWLCIKLDVNQVDRNTPSLVEEISLQVTLDRDAAGPEVSPDILAIRLGGRIIERIDRMHGVGLLITLDHAEKLPIEEVRSIRTFLQKLSVELNTGKKRPLRLRAAGRYGGAQWEKEFRPVILNPIMLSPFQFKYIKEAVEYALPSQQKTDLYSAYLLHVSAGHPGCMEEAIKILGSTEGDIGTHFLNFQAHTSKSIFSAAEEVRRSIQQDINEYATLVEKMCFFPILNRKLLKLLIETGYISSSLDPYKMEEILLQSHYYNRKDNCLHDHIARRVLVAEHRSTKFNEYKEQCQAALTFYKQRFAEDDDHADQIFLAILELEILLAASEEHRLSRESFLGSDGILERCKSLIDAKPIESRKNILTDLLYRITSDDAEESRVLFIFILRLDDFDPKFYERTFVDTIKTWKQVCM